MNVEKKMKRLYIYAGDQKGMVHIWYLSDILEKRAIFHLREEKKK